MVTIFLVCLLPLASVSPCRSALTAAVAPSCCFLDRLPREPFVDYLYAEVSWCGDDPCSCFVFVVLLLLFSVPSKRGFDLMLLAAFTIFFAVLYWPPLFPLLSAGGRTCFIRGSRLCFATYLVRYLYIVI